MPDRDLPPTEKMLAWGESLGIPRETLLAMNRGDAGRVLRKVKEKRLNKNDITKKERRHAERLASVTEKGLRPGIQVRFRGHTYVILSISNGWVQLKGHTGVLAPERLAKVT